MLGKPPSITHLRNENFKVWNKRRETHRGVAVAIATGVDHLGAGEGL